MELLLVLLPIALLAAVAGGGGGDDEEPPTPDGVTLGNATDEVVIGGAGSDLMLGEGGGDTLEGADGDDIVVGEAGADHLYGRANNDTLIGGFGSDDLYGGIGEDAIVGGAGDDLMRGGDGRDMLFGSSGADTLFGDLGADRLFAVDLGPDLAVGQATEPVSAGIGAVLEANLGAGVAAKFLDRINTSLLSSNSSTAADELYGGFGDDTLFADRGDTLAGGEGIDDFAVLAADATDAPVTVTDFDPATEVFDVQVTADRLSAALTIVDTPGGASVRLDGVAVGLLQGVTAASLGSGSVTLSPFNPTT